MPRPRMTPPAMAETSGSFTEDMAASGAVRSMKTEQSTVPMMVIRV